MYEGEATAARAVTSIAILAPRNGRVEYARRGQCVLRAAMDAPLAALAALAVAEHSREMLATPLPSLPPRGERVLNSKSEEIAPRR